MATKADIVLKVIDQATKKLKEIAAGVRGVAAEERVVTSAAVDLTTATKAQLQIMHDWVNAQLQAGATLGDLAQEMGLTQEQVQQLAFAVEDLTGKVKDQGIEILRIPKYIMGYRGGWLNLIATLGFGVSIFRVLHQVVAEFTDAIGEAARADYRLMQQIEAATSVWDAYKKGMGEGVLELARINIAGEEAELRLSRFHMIIEAVGRVIEETGIPVLREYGAMLKYIGDALGHVGEKADELSRQAERLTEEYQNLIDQRADEAFDAQRQAIFNASESAGEYSQRLMLLLWVSGELAPVLKEIGIVAFMQGAAFDYAAQQAAKLRERFERIMGVVGVMADLQQEAGDYTRDLADAHDSFADRVGDALFRAEQAWESFQFRISQVTAAFNFRMGQMQARFEHRMWSRGARAGAAAGAAAARLALSIETIKQDHYDRLEDMARKHQEELRRMLQRAPWYLQRSIREYQRRKKELEARGDKEGLARLKASFLERIRTIDPIFAEELEHLEELQQDERDVEEREFQQRLRRARARAAISRAQAQANAAISLADAVFAYGQQEEAAKFAQQQRLDAMKFAYGQQKEASDRAQAQALKDYEGSLEDINQTFGKFMSEFQRDVYREWFNAGYQATRGWYGGFGWPAPPRPTPSPPEPRWPKKQTGMPYVPGTMPVVVHTGEAILRKDQAAAWRGEGDSGDVYIQFYGPVTMYSRQAVHQLATDISRELGRRAYVRRG